MEGEVVLKKKQSIFGQDILFSLQLISRNNPDPANGLKGKVGRIKYCADRINTLQSWSAENCTFKLHFEWDDEVGIPGAFQIQNLHNCEFFLVHLTLKDVRGHGDIHFPCNSWVFPTIKDLSHRIFFTNETYLPNETPSPLVKYREEELLNLRGNGTRELQKWDRVYDYATYNDLGNPDKGEDHARPVLGGNSTYPYPRRGRTGRLATNSDRNSERRVKGWTNIYVPRDEEFTELKTKDMTVLKAKLASNVIQPKLLECEEEFESLEDVLKLYTGGYKIPKPFKKATKYVPKFMKQTFHIDNEEFFKLQMPEVIRASKTAWMTDEEFARQMLAGVNPVKICRLQEFPPKSKLDKTLYGDQTSKMTEKHIEINLEGLTVKEAMRRRKLFLLDYQDDFMPYLSRINATSSKGYASRTILFLKNDGTLKPLAIELSLPHPNGDRFGAISEVYLPSRSGVEKNIWNLAKTLHTHAVIEPFIIATNRQLSVLHPIHKLLRPHFRDTMRINATARSALINEGGTIESTFLPGKYAMEISSIIYKNWVFTEQALPNDLIKRGMAIRDPTSAEGLDLVIKDYPYAVDGLEIWFAIKAWVRDYCSIFYKTDYMVQQDPELQSWWKELVKVGHGDKKDEPWWPEMQTRDELIESCTIIIWIASALHAPLNFGQYSYGGYILNRPTLSRRYMPKKGTPEYYELETNLEKALLKTITPRKQALDVLSVIEILSKHTYDEIYLGQRDITNWTSKIDALIAFENFGRQITEIGERIRRRNCDASLKNRYGEVRMPYTLLSPSSDAGLTGKGIPNSVSI
ncbi:seed linoleate 9S-lipoxygenase-3-like isoform X2 [Prosopis cineraria]|uniref:seed linoleate 9S-lipoxygenase-3-like isoform X2 n=1 Tax=Prosopis cineraria TaxID=364024 RepID=UPI0024106DC8|nr:seed linoleate 9S-lipoxygenase-3-like isoform X2 [Prosopis cineraria]